MEASQQKKLNTVLVMILIRVYNSLFVLSKKKFVSLIQSDVLSNAWSINKIIHMSSFVVKWFSN